MKHPDYWKPKEPAVAAVVPACLAALDATVLCQQCVIKMVVSHMAKDSNGAGLADLLADGKPMERERGMAEVVT